MNNDDYMTPKNRSNNLISNESISSNNPIHVFTNPSVLSPAISSLKNQCQKNNIPIIIHTLPDQLNNLVFTSKNKTLVVIQTPRQSSTDISYVFPDKFIFPKSTQKVKIISFPNKLANTNYDVVKDKSQIFHYYDKLNGIHKQSSKIKLRKIHSSKDIKYQLASPQTLKSPPKKDNKQIIFHRLVYSDYKVNPDSEFKILTQSIKNTPGVFSCLNFNQLKLSADTLPKNSKLLFLVDQKGIKQWRQYMEKNKLTQKCQLMILGDLKPSKQLLKNNVYFASDNGQQILNQLQKLKFQQVGFCRSQFIRLTTARKNQFRFSQNSIKIAPYNSTPVSNQQQFNAQDLGYNNNLMKTPQKQRNQLHRYSQQFTASIFSNASSQFERYLRNWTVDIDPNQKDKQRARYLTMEQQGKFHIDGPSQPMSKRASRITGRRNSSEGSQQHFGPTNNLVDQYMRIKNKQSSNTYVNIPMPHDIQLHKMHNSQKQIMTNSQQYSSTTAIQQKSPTGQKKVIQIMKKSNVQNKHQTKHQQIPSNVIQQTSQQYRGSNRQSIVNMDDHFYHYSQNQISGSGNNLGSTGNMPSNFSKVKNTTIQPMEIPGNKRTVHQQQTYPAEDNFKITNLGYGDVSSKQQLPLQSPSHSQIMQKQRIIDGKTGQLIGNYGFNNVMNTPERPKRNNYQTISPMPYQSQSLNINPLQRINNEAYIIDGQTGQLVGESKRKMQRWMIAPYSGFNQSSSSTQYIASPSKPAQQQILRPSHYIQPQIVKIPYSSSSSINDKNSRSQIATQKKIANNNNYNSTSNNIKNNTIQSTTSIRGPYDIKNSQSYYNNGRNLGYESPTNINNNYNYDTKNNYSKSGYETVNYVNNKDNQKWSSSNNNYNSKTNIITTNHTPSNNSNSNNGNYKIYTAEEYASRYQTTNNNKTANTVTHHHTTISNPTSNNYQSTTVYQYNQKQPQVVDRVYIKATNLPDYQNNNLITKRYQTNSNTTHNYKVIGQDNDIFNQRTPSKYSSNKIGSYVTRKQEVKKDTYTLYDNNNSLLANQKSGIKVYTPQQYQKVVQNRKLNSPNKQFTINTTTNNGIDFNQYDRVVQNGVTVYKPKNSVSYERTIITNDKDNSSKLQAKTLQTNRNNYHQSSTSKVTVVNSYQSNGITRYQPTGRNYANSPTRREGSSYQKSLKYQNPLRRPSQQTYEISNTIQVTRNVVPLKDQQVKPLVYDSKSPMKVTEYKTTQGKTVNTYTYNSLTRHVYERRQMPQPRVQASNFNPRIDNKLPQNEIGIISGINKNSQIFELSDGSIMRRNNIKFGINKYRGSQQMANQKADESFEYLQHLKSRIQSKIINMSQIYRNAAIEKKLTSQQQVLNQKQTYSYINTFVNQFYFLIDEELGHLVTWITKYLKSRNDRVQSFRGMDQMYQKMKNQKINKQFDITLVFVKNQDINKINKKLVPEDCFIVQILGQDYKGLEVSQKDKKIKLSKLPNLKLAQKIIIQSMLTHIILYQKGTSVKNQGQYFNKQVSHILSLFPDGQFIKQPYDSPLSLELMNSLIDDPKFSRLYIICNEKQMSNVVSQLQRVSQQSGIPQQIYKIICIPSDNQILKHQQKIQTYPRVAWMTNGSKINYYKSLIKYALRQQEDDNLYTKQQSQQKQKIYYHTRHRNLNILIQKEFPSRFQFQAFNSLGQVQKKILKLKTQKAKENIPKKQSSKQKTTTPQTIINYLILHPILSDEYIDIKLFKKIFMLGKSDKAQKKVIKVSSNQELLQLLKR